MQSLVYIRKTLSVFSLISALLLPHAHLAIAASTDGKVHGNSLPTTPMPTASTSAPASMNSVKPTIVGHQLNRGATGTRLELRGITVWGVEDHVTGSFGVDEYKNLQTIVNTVKAWGGNVIRLRLLASDYNNQTYMSQAQELQEIRNWQITAQAAGIYLQVVWWDSLDGPYKNDNWAKAYSNAFPMMRAVLNELGPTNPWVIYEPFNEPNHVSQDAWLEAMRTTDAEFRSNGYTGILLFDTNGWSHTYNDTDMNSLEKHDAALPGMQGTHQVIFAKHDYANEYPNFKNGFTSGYWPKNNNGTTPWDFNKHLVFETEFGNYNGRPSSVSYPWSQGAATWIAREVSNGTLVGAETFVFGPWYDANALTLSDNETPTQWGSYVKNSFLQ